MELLPGTNVTNLDPETTPEYSDEHIKQLIKTVIELYNHGVVIDPKPSNFMYDEEHGFSILDFHLLKWSHSIGDIVMSLSHALTARKWPRLDYESDDYEEQSKANTIARYKVHLPLMIKFLRILKNDFPDILLDYHRSYDIRERKILE